MKKYTLYLILVIFTLSACKRDALTRYEIEKSFPDPAVKFEDLKKAISSGTEGFKMIIIRPTGGGLIGGYVKFDATLDAKFVADNNLANATTPINTKYNLKISQTNSVLSFPGSGNFGVLAGGLGIDTAYSYKSTVGDTLKFVGDVLGSRMNLIKVIKKDGDEYMAGKMAETMTAVGKLKSFKKYFKRITVDGKSYDLMINDVTKSIVINYAAGTEFKTFSAPYAYTNTGIEFKKPLKDGALNINSITNLIIDDVSATGTAIIDGKSAVLTNEAAPVIIDKTIGPEFSAVDKQFRSFNGFTRDAVVDYFGVKTLPNFSRITFWVKYNVAYDLAGFTNTSNQIQYGPAVTASISADGILKYTLFGVLGTLPTNTTQRNIVVNTINTYLSAQGFYVIKTGPTTYDFVSVTGGNIWISYE